MAKNPTKIEKMLLKDDTYNVLFKIPELIKKLKDLPDSSINESDVDAALKAGNLSAYLGRTIHIDLVIDDVLQIIVFLEDLIKTKRENEELKETLNKVLDKVARALEAYSDKDKRFEIRSADALKVLGFSKGKRKPKHDNGFDMLFEYVGLICGGYDDEFKKIPPLSKFDAIQHLKEKYDFQSYKACLQFLRRAWTKHVKKLEAAGESHSWAGILPGNPTT